MLLKYIKATEKVAIKQSNDKITYAGLVNIIELFISFFNKTGYKIVFMDTDILVYKIGIIMAGYYTGRDIFMPDKFQVTDNILKEHNEICSDIYERCILSDDDISQSFAGIHNSKKIKIKDILTDYKRIDFDFESLTSNGYIWFTTSGTTEDSRVVGLNMKYLFDKFEAIDNFLDIREDDILLSFSSPSFIQVLWSILLHLKHNATIVFQNIMLKDLHLSIKQFSITTLVTVPTIISGCIDQLYGLRSIIVGGDYMRADVLKKLTLKIPDLIYANVYGCTETGAGDMIVPATRLGDIQECGYSLGKINPMSDISFIPTHNNLFEIAITNRCFLTAKSIKKEAMGQDSAFRTGDIIRMDCEGKCYYVGRSSNVVVTNGIKISVDVVEKEILKIPDINDVLVFGIDCIKGEKLVVLYQSDKLLDKKYFIDRLVKSLLSHEIPNEYVKIADIPYTDRGKKERRKKKLKEIYTMHTYKKQNKAIAVWGVGYIGMTTLSSLAYAGYRCFAIDISKKVVDNIRNADDYLPLLNEYFKASYIEAIRNLSVEAYTPDEFLCKEISIDAHFICVPTERQGMPQMDDVFSTIQSICNFEKRQLDSEVLIVIESTLVPGTGKELHNYAINNLNKTIRFAVAPRRDWFEKDHNMSDIIRIYGADSDASADIVESYLKITTPIIKKASHYEVSEIVKPVENAFRHLDIMLAQQLSLSYGNIDIREVLELAGTKWNMQTYFPSIGIGGYCIPVSSKYILAGNNNEHLTLLNAVVDFEKQYADSICEYLCSFNIKQIGIIGSTYKSDIAVLNGSPLTYIIEKLREKGVKVRITDPLFESKDLEAYFNVETFDLQKIEHYMFDGFIVNNWHKIFDIIINSEIISQIFNCKFVLDNTGKLENFAKSKNIKNYRLFGRPFWRNSKI